ncbi:MAG TPA: hypothetical protein VGB24_00675 [Longimicrobium sp.]|jgi:hypothetical protein|uniref:hypothetical protein n=1 Tax=Longimicrobium sp. TaxID=2029185 RepID=UPI002ED83E1E
MRSYLRAAALTLAAIAALADVPAQAQLGGMIRRGAGRVVGSAAAGAATQAATPAATPAPAPRAPTFDEHTLEVTAPVLERFIASLNAEAAERTRVAGERSRAGELRAQVERYERCQQRENEARDARGADLAANAGPELAMRLSQAMMRGDTVTYYRLMDSVMTVQRGGPSQCGERPAQAYETLRRLDNSDHIAGIAADAGSFTIRQLAVLRERIAPWVLSGGGQGSFTTAEREVLERRGDELRRYAEQLQS